MAIVGELLLHNASGTLTLFAPGRERELSLLTVQEKLEDTRASFEVGGRCREVRESEEMASFLDAVDAGQEPEENPFNSDLTDCLGIPAAAMEGIRLLTIRADGLESVFVAMGTRDFVHARDLGREDSIVLAGHRFFVVAVPEASPVAVVGYHKNQELPLIWRGHLSYNRVVWAVPYLHSCLDLSVTTDPDTMMFVDGVRVGRGSEAEVCSTRSADEDVQTLDRILDVTLDRPGSGVPDHEILLLACEGHGKGRRPVVRYLSSVAATASPQSLRRAGQCEPIRIDVGTRTRQRVAVLAVTKLPGCEATPLWASDVQERVRHTLAQDSAHRDARVYANFSAYAEATEALNALQTQLGGDDGTGPDRGATTNALLGAAAREAWRQGIDTLLSFAVLCTPRGENDRGEPQWTYSIRATSIQISDLFARGYYNRERMDLDDFIDVESVGFTSVSQQDASVGALLDRVFRVDTPRFAPPPDEVHYRRSQPLWISRYFASSSRDYVVPEEIRVGYRAFRRVGQPRTRRERKEKREKWGPYGRDIERPQVCTQLMLRGTRPPSAIDVARKTYDELRSDERVLVLERSRDEIDTVPNPRAVVHRGELRPPRPGWYLVVVKGEEGEIEDAVCIYASSHPADVWGEISILPGGVGRRTTSSFYLRPRIGATWYTRGRWFGGGGSLGYGFGGYEVRFDDLDLAWQRHAILVAPHVEFRTRSTKSPLEFRARVGTTLDIGWLAASNIDPSLNSFWGGSSDSFLDPDLDIGIDYVVGVPVGPVQLQAIFATSYNSVDDVRRMSAVRADSGLFLGFGFGVSGGVR